MVHTRNGHTARKNRQTAAHMRAQEGYVTKDWRWGGPTMIPHEPVLNMSRHLIEKSIPSMAEAADAFAKVGRVFNQFTDIDQHHTDIIQVNVHDGGIL